MFNFAINKNLHPPSKPGHCKTMFLTRQAYNPYKLKANENLSLNNATRLNKSEGTHYKGKSSNNIRYPLPQWKNSFILCNIYKAVDRI